MQTPKVHRLPNVEEESQPSPVWSPPPIAPIRLGQVIPQTSYRVIGWLGEGGMGVVYLAEHIKVGRRYAVKVLRMGPETTPETVALFRNEARVTTDIGSDHIIEIYDFVELIDGRLLIAMEALQGVTLVELVREPMAPARAVGILRQMCKGLASAHHAGVIHCDIKPENVFLCEKPARDFAKLLDFGVSALAPERVVYRRALGTPNYMPPEMLTRGEITPASDIYSVGCVAYEMLTGRMVFPGDATRTVAHNLLHTTPPPPSAICGSVPPALEKVVMRCLAKEPQHRYPDMVELEAALCEAQVQAKIVTEWDHLPLPAVDPKRRERLQRMWPNAPRRRTERWIIGTVAGGVALALGGLAAGIAVSRSEPPVTVVEEISVVDELAERARNSAARAQYVYPPSNSPDAETAYQLVLKLEAIEGQFEDAANERAQGLRNEFADTLIRLGDELWDQDGGKMFAVNYYQQAVIFVPGRDGVRERASLSDEELTALSGRAKQAEFSPVELLEAERAAVLAEPDPEQRARKFEEYRVRRTEQANLLDEELAALIGIQIPVERPRGPRTSGKTTKPRPSTTGTGAPAVAEPEPEPEPEVPTTPSPPESKRDPAAARHLAKQGRTAMRARKPAEAKRLFEQALAADRQNTMALAGMRDIYFEDGDYGRAVKYGKRVVRVLSGSAEHHLRLGDAYFKTLQYRDALKHYEKAKSLGDSRADWRVENTRKKIGR